MTSKASEIYVSLLNEGVEVWRPVRAEHISDNIYRIAPQEYNSRAEIWEFVPGDLVICEITKSSTGDILAAVSRASCDWS